MTNEFLIKWQTALKTKDSQLISDLLADDVVFYSPVVYTPQEGKMITYMYLLAASTVLANESFKYVHTSCDDSRVVLEFETEMDGIYVNGVDIIDLNSEGKISQMKVMVRPLQAMNKLHEMMGAMLSSMK